MARNVWVWDGLKYTELREADAEILVKEDKAQHLSYKMVSSLELKLRRNFTGYWTREMRAEAGLLNEPVELASKPKTAAKKSKHKTKTN